MFWSFYKDQTLLLFYLLYWIYKLWPEIKNHLSIEESIGAAGSGEAYLCFSKEKSKGRKMTYSRDFNRFSLVGRFFNRGVDTKKHDISPNQSQTIFSTYVSISFLSVVPLMSCFQASWVSKMISVAYFLFLASPLKAKTFSGFPSGIL